MNVFLLACYICLQLTNVSELNQHAIIKRDNACEQCLTGIFDHSELMSQVGTQPDQSSGNLLASNSVLKEALEERLMLELSQSSLKSKLQPKGEPNNEVVIDHQLERAPVVTEETLKATEQALRTMQETVVNNIREASQEMLLQLRQQQVQLGREFELLAAKQRELMMKEMALAKETVKKTEEKPLVKNVLKSNAKLMAGESLVSENGRYKATLQKNGELVITDKYQEDRIVKKIGQAMRTPSDNVYMHLQQDGNLVIYSRLYQGNNFDYPIWQSGTSVRKAWYTGAKTMDGSDYHLKLEVNGQLVMYDGIGRQIWISGKLESRQKVILMPDLIEYI